MGPKADRTMTHPFNRQPNPTDTSWVPGSTAPQSHQSGSLNPVSAPEGPPQNDGLPDLHPDLALYELFPELEGFSDWSTESHAPTGSPNFFVEALSTLREQITSVVTDSLKRGYQGPLETIVQEIFEVCEDDAKLIDMCAYDALCACYQGGLPVEIENEIMGQPWAQNGKDASDKYKSYLRECQDMSQLTRELLQHLAGREHQKYLDQAKRNMEDNSSRAFASPVPNAFFNHNPASPKRRPSARTPNRDLGSPLYGNRSPDRGQKAGSPKTGSRSDEESSPKRVRRANEHDGGTQWVAQRSALPTLKGKEPDNLSPTQTSPRRAQTPPDLVFPSGTSDSSRSGTHHGRRPRSAESKPSQAQSKGKQPDDENVGASSKSKESAPGRLRPTIRNQYRRNVVENNQMVPRGKLDPYDRLKYENAFKFLGGENQMSYYVGLEEQLDHIIHVFKRHRVKGLGPFHVTKGRCDSDDDDIPQGCCPQYSKQKQKKCYIKFHADMLAFHGKGPKEYTDSFRTIDFFFKCVSRALTKILFQYCQENKIPEPIFYPNYIEEALIQYTASHPRPEEGEGPHLAMTLGINAQQIEKKLIMLRAKQINQYDQQKELTDAQIVGTKHEQEMNPPQTFPGDNAFHRVSPRFTKAISSWLISNKDKLTPQNRLPDNKTVEKWLKILEEEHPELKSHCNRQLIDQYCLRYQHKHFQKFPLLPQPNTNAPAEEPESSHTSSRPAPSMPPPGRAEVIVLSSEGE